MLIWGKLFLFILKETKKVEILRVKNIPGLGWENQALAVGKAGISLCSVLTALAWGFSFMKGKSLAAGGGI